MGLFGPFFAITLGGLFGKIPVDLKGMGYVYTSMLAKQVTNFRNEKTLNKILESTYYYFDILFHFFTVV